CWYHSNLLAEVEQYFVDQPELEGLIGRAVSEQGRTSLTRFGSYAKVVNCYDVWRCSATFTMFYRRHALPAIPVFNENLGVGASTPWGAAEDTQLLIDVLNNGSKVFYQPSLTIFHPDPFTYPRQVLHLRGYKYGCGMGYVMGINHYPRWFFNYYLLRSVAGIALALCSGKWNKLDHNLQTLKGRWYGWRTAHQELSR
ncbi:MAG: glycosyltransferase family 2 protein, partial [Methanomassiliicoccales archaeon]